MTAKEWFYNHWIGLSIIGCTAACLDILATAWGILVMGGEEGNPFVTMIIPPSEPVLTIGFISALVICEFSMVCYYGYNKASLRAIIGVGMVFVTMSHMFGVVSWMLWYN